MASHDIEYYRQRAEAEALRALEARTAAAAAAHNALSELYEARVAVPAGFHDEEMAA